MVIKVFVGNLAATVTEDALRDVFSPYGKVLDLRIVKNFAFVSFANRQEAENSVKDLHKTKMAGNTLIVEISKKQDEITDSRHRENPRHSSHNQRGSSRNGPPRNGPPMHGPPLGGILTPIEQVNQLGALGVFSAVNTLAAVESQVRKADIFMEQRNDLVSDPYTTPRNDRRANINNSIDHGTDRGNVNDGYVIYERYYVDPSHPLLRGLPLPKLNRMTDSYVSPREPEVCSSYNSGYGEYRR